MTISLHSLLNIIVTCCVMVGSGVLVGYILLITPLRQFAVQSSWGRCIVTLLGVLLAGTISLYAVGSLLAMTISIAECNDTLMIDDWESPSYCDRDEHGGLIAYPRGEIRLRLIVPAPLQPVCFSGNSAVCEVTDQLMRGDVSIWHSKRQLYLWSFATVSGLSAGLTIWRFTHRKCITHVTVYRRTDDFLSDEIQ